ncbi:Flavodoxin [Natronincola peptidivorans]|uniref:Flavodoxin n=1 Tax=Natronincola peptidivorans TaxID=426128 RepID=A0A1I0C9I1_9FIRM|nr:flavodoxin [Natronincola peptidivorans]SET16226.1 Flavodoxin [Natronincola peptidivorans]
MSNKPIDLKKLVIYYSFEGNTRFIAEAIARSIDADILELKPKQEIASKGFMKYVWGGSQVVMKKRPELCPLDVDPLDYDVIFIGSPVWAWTFAPPLNTFFDAVKITKKKVALFSCNGGQNGKTFDNMEAVLQSNEVIGKIEFLDPLKKNKEKNAEKAEEWAKTIVNNL